MEPLHWLAALKERMVGPGPAGLWSLWREGWADPLESTVRSRSRNEPLGLPWRCLTPWSPPTWTWLDYVAFPISAVCCHTSCSDPAFVSR